MSATTFELCGSRNFREQLAAPVENPNHHDPNESNAESADKLFFSRKSLCMIPLLQQTRERQDAKASCLSPLSLDSRKEGARRSMRSFEGHLSRRILCD
jgi:hypothetical protein